MGKIASKCCKPCEAGNEAGNANLEQYKIQMNNFDNGNGNETNYINRNKARTSLSKCDNNLIKKYNCKF